jgi:hypothetical protein
MVERIDHPLHCPETERSCEDERRIPAMPHMSFPQRRIAAMLT